MKEFEDAMLDIAWNNLCTEQSRYKDSDAKSVSLITIAGVLTTLLIGFGPRNNSTWSIFYALSIAFMLLAVVFSIIAMWPRSVEVLSTNKLLNDFEHAVPDRQVPGIIATVAKAESSLRDVNYKKAKQVRFAVASLAVAVMMMLLYSFVLFFR